MTETESGIVYEPVRDSSWRDEARFLIPDVVYRGQKGTYLLFEKMTLPMTQDALIELYDSEKAEDNPHPTDMPLVWAIATRGFDLRDKNQETAGRLRQSLRTGFRSFPNTLTRLHYSSGNDAIIHNVGTADQYSIETEVTGVDGFITKIPDKKVLEALLGTGVISKIDEVSNWVNGTNSHIWRLNSKPKQLDKRVARFSADGNWLDFYCNWSLHVEDPAFRVLRIE